MSFQFSSYKARHRLYYNYDSAQPYLPGDVMERDVVGDLTVGVQTYYGLTEQTARQVALHIFPWVKKQFTLNGILLPQRTESQDERYSLLIGRLVESDVVAAAVKALP